MRVLFDQGTPVPLRQSLTQHEVATVYEIGWSTLSNGDLLDSAEGAGYAVLVTTDTNLRHQQNLESRRIAVVVLTTPSWPRIRRFVPEIAEAVDRASPGSYMEVEVPWTSEKES